MSSHRARARHRKPTFELEYAGRSCRVWLPDPAEPIIIAGIGDAISLAWTMLDMPVEREALVLLDEQRQITCVMLDPPADVGLFVGLLDGPGLEVPFCQTLCVELRDAVSAEPPSTHDRECYFSLRRVHAVQGLLLLDVILVDTERVQSLAAALDSDCIWFEDFPTAADA